METEQPTTKEQTDLSPQSQAASNDAALHTVITHLHTPVADLEARVAARQPSKRARLVAAFPSRHTLLAWLNHLPTSRVQQLASRFIDTVATQKQRTVLRQPTHDDMQQETDSHEEDELAELPIMVRMTILTLLSLLCGWVSDTVVPLAFVPWFFYAIAYINGSYYSVLEAWHTLARRRFDINILMISAALGAAVVGQPFEGALLLFLFSLSHTLETYAMGRTHASIRALIAMTPKMARVLRPHATSSSRMVEIDIAVEQLVLGDIVRVRPGEQIPADGTVRHGTSSVNEASITGESVPVEKQPDDRVFAGTINEHGMLDVCVTKTSDDSTLAHIVKVVREARQQKARSQYFTDKVIGEYYAYTVVGLTLLAVIVPLLFLGWDVQTTVYRAITLMVGASPCALVISIPAAILSALATSSRSGVLFKGGKHLESAARVQVVAFDKTGTLTTGTPSVAAILPFAPLPDGLHQNIKQMLHEQDRQEQRNRATQFAADSHTSHDSHDLHDTAPFTPAQRCLLALAASIEHYSEHPLARAIVAHAETFHLPLLDATDFEAIIGSGVRATLAIDAQSMQVQVGRPTSFAVYNALHEQAQQNTDQVSLIYQQITDEQRNGRTVILVGNETELWGAIALADTVRPESAASIANLRQAGIQYVVLLTGDHRMVAESLARAVGVDEVYAELTPEQKVAVIRLLEAANMPVAMIGDGINDAPALATATLGIAMGAAGTDVAMESADVVLTSDDLSRLPGIFRLARRTRTIIWQNLVVAFATMLLLMVFALSGTLPLTLATIAHEGSTLLVVMNGLRLLALRDTTFG